MVAGPHCFYASHAHQVVYWIDTPKVTAHAQAAAARTCSRDIAVALPCWCLMAVCLVGTSAAIYARAQACPTLQDASLLISPSLLMSHAL